MCTRMEQQTLRWYFVAVEFVFLFYERLLIRCFSILLPFSQVQISMRMTILYPSGGESSSFDFSFFLSLSLSFCPIALKSDLDVSVEGWRMKWNKIQIKFLCVHSYCELKCTIKIKFRITFALEVNWASWSEKEEMKAFLKALRLIVNWGSSFKSLFVERHDVTSSADDSSWISLRSERRYFMILQTDMKNSMFKGTKKHKFRIIESIRVEMKGRAEQWCGNRNVYWVLSLFWKKNMEIEIEMKILFVEEFLEIFRSLFQFIAIDFQRNLFLRFQLIDFSFMTKREKNRF